MRIVVFVADFPPVAFGGVGIHAHELTLQLTQAGNEVDVFVTRMGDVEITGKYTTESNEGYTVYRFCETQLNPQWSGLSSDVRNCLTWATANTTALESVLKIAAARQYDVIHVHDFFSMIPALAVRDKLCIPVINTVHASSFHLKGINFQLRKYMCMAADRNITVSRYLCEDLQRDTDLHNISFRIIHNGVSFRECTENIINETGHDILMAGEVKVSKGCFELLKAFLELAKNNELPKDARLVFAGKGSDYEALRSFVEENHLCNRVVLTGHLPYEEVRDTIHRSLVLVALGQHEPFGLTTLEALAENTCVIASDCGGFKEYLTDGRDSLLVDPFSTDEIKNALKRIFNDAELRKQLYKYGKKTAREYCWKRTAKETLEVYNECLTERKNNGNRSTSHLQNIFREFLAGRNPFDIHDFMKDNGGM